jgi:acetyltransferase
MKGRNLAIISRAGGHAVMAADACELSGFQLARFPESFLRRIEEHFRATVIRLTNPLDLGDLFDLDVYAEIVEQTLKLENVDGIVFLHTSLGAEHDSTRLLLDRVIDLVERYEKPVAFYISSDAEEVAYLKQNYSYPIFTAVVETIRALEMNHRFCCEFKRFHDPQEYPIFEVDRQAARDLVHAARNEERDLLLSEAMEVLEVYGIPTAQSIVARNVDEVRKAADEMGYPVAIKVIAEQISHKSDVGGVQLNLYNSEAVAEAFQDMMTRIGKAYPEAKLDGVLVQPMVTGGRELILGGRQDPQFGPVVLVGLGGIFVEIFEEVSVRVTPITRGEAESMLDELRGSQILKGARGHMPSDIDSVVDALLRLSQLLNDFPEITEVDINPLRVFHQDGGCRALDARMILG